MDRFVNFVRVKQLPIILTLRKYLISLLVSMLFGIAGYPQALTNVGSDFWIAFPPNFDMMATLEIFISSDFSTSGTVTSAFPGVDQVFTVTPGTVTQLTVPSGVALFGGVEDKGIRVTANDPIAVYGLNLKTATTDAYMALPISSLGVQYRVLTYTTTLNGEGSSFSVVATQDATELTIFNHQTSNTYTVNLNAGQTYHEDSPVMGEDLTGSRIMSNFPVAVFGSVNGTNVPAGCTFADHIVEQMFPVSAWGKRFVTVPLAGRDASGDIFRILAGEDNTDVEINGTLIATLNSGEYYETNLTEYNGIETSNATLVAQYAKGTTCSGGTTGDPFMMLIPPREQFLTSYTICTLAGFTSHWVNIVAPSNAIGLIYKDGVLIPPGSFTPIGTTTFYGAQISISEGSHTFNSTIPFGVFVYGWTNVNSYGYPGGGSLSPVGTVASVTITPATTSGILDVTTVCFTAHVEDDFNNPVEGVLVNFMISGCSTITGNAYTDASGDAQYCYMQSGTVSCIDNVYAEIFGFTSSTSTVNWTYLAPCTNPSDGGAIGNDQTGCDPFVPTPVINITSPSGHSGTLEFKWQESITDGITGFVDIPGSNSANYSPGILTQTTWFRRVARVDCKPDWTDAVYSNAVQVTVLPVLPVSVSVTPSANPICLGTPVTFTAVPINEGTTPQYQWQVNGINAGTNNPVFTYIPASLDLVTCILTSSEVCTSNNPDTSNVITMTVNPILPVSVSVTPSENPICLGTPVTFTAVPINEGTTPQYQWQVNGINAGTNNPVFTYIPASLDLVTCILTSSLPDCLTNNPDTSTAITMIGFPVLAADITVTASPNPSCQGVPVTFTANPVNGGSNPTYQWQVNGINVGTNSTVYTYIPASLDLVSCIMTSNLVCVINNPASSIQHQVSVNPNPTVTFAPCFDTITTTNAKPIKLKGGIPLGGTYSGAGVSGGYFYPNLAGVGTHIVTYSYTNVATCSASSISRIHEFTNPIFNCGNDWIDIRDGKSYPTIQIGTQCWMAADLNYGNEIPANIHQRDNCVTENYRTAVGGRQTAFYQWDELMQFSDTPGIQGLCPPAWHIPTETEWATLFANWTNNAFAAATLKYSGYSGFNAFLSGARHGTVQWDYQNFAAFFWSSTSYGPYKAWAHGMNDPDPSVSYYPALRSNAFSVRCLRD